MSRQHFQNIYTRYAAEYDRLVSYEDFQGHLIQTLEQLVQLPGRRVVEFAAGTGRLTESLARSASHVSAYDESPEMLDKLKHRLSKANLHNFTAATSEHRSVPQTNARYDLAIECWAFGHLTEWYPESWEEELDLAIDQMKKLVRPEGHLIVIETLGTGVEKPIVPTAKLEQMYSRLENTHHFQKRWIRTDYQFPSMTEARELTNLFFGSEFKLPMGFEKDLILHECTGIWLLALDSDT